MGIDVQLGLQNLLPYFFHASSIKYLCTCKYCSDCLSPQHGCILLKFIYLGTCLVLTCCFFSLKLYF